VAGAFLLVIGAALRAINGSDVPPPRDRLLLEKASLHRMETYSRKGSSGAYLFAGGSRYVFPGPKERAMEQLAPLSPGDPVEILYTPASFGSRTVWQISRRGEVVVPYDLLSRWALQRRGRVDTAARAMMGVGAAGIAAGAIAATAFRRRRSAPQWEIGRVDGGGA
jgi:hypothetical protein